MTPTRTSLDSPSPPIPPIVRRFWRVPPPFGIVNPPLPLLFLNPLLPPRKAKRSKGVQCFPPPSKTRQNHSCQLVTTRPFPTGPLAPPIFPYQSQDFPFSLKCPSRRNGLHFLFKLPSFFSAYLNQHALNPPAPHTHFPKKR